MIVKEELLIDNLIIYQDTDLYRFTSDSILLSKFAVAKKNEKVADLCSGSGIVGLHFYALNKDKCLSVDLYEMQEELFNLCNRTIKENSLTDKVTTYNVKVQDILVDRHNSYDVILCNPPYQKVGTGVNNLPYHLRVCREEVCLTFSEIVQKTAKLLKPKGRFYFVNKAERLAEITHCLVSNGLEPKTLQFIAGGDNQKPYLMMIEAVKGAKSGLTVLPNLTNKQ